MSSLLLAVVIFAASPRAAARARVQEEVYGEVVSVREALVDVLVVDRSGNSVPGLGSKDFELRYRGERVPIRSMRYYGCLGPSGVSGLEDPLAPRPESRFFLLLSRLSGSRSAQVTADVEHWMLNGPQPWDLVGVATFGRSFEVQASFTRDRTTAQAALERWRAGTSGVADGQAFVEALHDVAVAAGPIQRRKNLVLVTDGLGAVLPREALAPAVRALNSSGVAVYVIDLGMPRGERAAFRRLAEKTSGQFFGAFRDASVPLAQILLQNAGYYLLSFVPPDDAQHGDPHVVVEARDGRYHALALPRQRALR